MKIMVLFFFVFFSVLVSGLIPELGFSILEIFDFWASSQTFELLIFLGSSEFLTPMAGFALKFHCVCWRRELKRLDFGPTQEDFDFFYSVPYFVGFQIKWIMTL